MSNKTFHSSKASASGITRRKLYVAMLAASQLMAAGEVWAAPDGGKVVGGAGTIDQSGLDTTIHQSTERMAIDWQSFDVKANERVQFIQPKSSSIALNRVVSNKGSEILGRIDANGQVFLINPNGVVFGKDSQINVGGIVASGLNIDPNDFMNGQYTLTALEGTEGKVINSGIINAATGGSVTLVGQQVKNEGLISANLGAVSLAAGKEAVVTFDKAGLVGIKVTKEVLQKELGVDAAVLNSGEINAEGGKILIAASVSQDIFSEAVNNGGMNKASSVVVHEDGSFTLGAGSDVVNTGSINASKESGDAGQVVVLGNNITNSGEIHADAITGTAGSIELHSTDTTSLEQNAKVTAKTSTQGVGGDVKALGNKVGLFDNAEVNASGANGGGQVLIGGDQTGANIKIRNADFIYVDDNATVKTDALLNGDGGKLITFASNTARIYGSLSARGGSESGNGGFIETSGLKGFEIFKTPDVGAAAGHAGTWLIDPEDIEILDTNPNKPNISNHQNTNVDKNSNGGTGKWIFTPSASGAKLDVLILEEALSANGTVIVKTTDTSGNGTTGAGTITFNSDLRYDFTGPGNHPDFATLIFDADKDIIFNKSIVRDSSNGNKLNIELKAKGNIQFSASAQIETQGGYFTVSSGVDFKTTDRTDAAISTNGGNVSLNVTGKVLINSGIDTSGGDFTAVLSKSFDNSSVNGKINTGTGNVFISDSGIINLGNITSKNLTIGRTGSDTTFKVTQNNSTALTISGDTTFDVLSAGAGSVTLNSGSNNFTNVSFTSAGDVDIRDDGAINLGASTISGTFNLASGGNVSQSDAITVKGATTLSASGKNIDLSNQNNDFQSTVSTANTESVGSLKIVDKNDITIGTISIDGTGANSIAATNGILLNGNITTTGGDIEFKNKVALGTAITINTKSTSVGNITFDDVVTSTTANDLSLTGKTITFLGNVGSAANRLGTLTIDATGNVNASGRDIYATALNTKNATGFVANNINTVGSDGFAGGAVTVNTSGTVNIGSIDTRGGLSSTALGLNGGNISIVGTDVTPGAINTSGSNADHLAPIGSGGNAGTVTITGTNSVTLAKDIITQAGTGMVPGAVATAQVTAGDATHAGTVNLNYTDFFTSLINIIGANANDILNGFNLAAVWNISGANSGTITKKDTNKTITFTGFEKVVGGTQDDSFVIGASGSIATIDGGSGTNTITSRDAVANVWLITDSNQGSLTNVNAFSNIQNLQGGSGNDTFDFSSSTTGANTGFIDGGVGTNKLIGRNQANSWNITGAAAGNITGYVASFTKIQTLQGGSAVDTFNINTAFSGTINGGAGNDIFNINAATTGSLSGEADDDSFLIGDSGSAVAIHGNGGSNTLTGRNANNTWNITAANTGSVDNVTAFDGIQKLLGGSGIDKFVFQDGGSIVSADGGTGANTLDWSALTADTTLTLGSAAVNGVTNVSTVVGSATKSFTLNAGDSDNIWTIDGIDSGTVGSIRFINFKNLVGGSGTDIFNFSTVSTNSISGKIDGGTGTNILLGHNLATIWNITNVNQGTLRDTASGSTYASFVGIQTLKGSAADDSFIFDNAGKISSLDGGLGSNNLTGRNLTTTWNISATNAGSLFDGSNNQYAAFSNIQSLLGGSAKDTFNINSAFTGDIKGGAGDDIFTINAAAGSLYGEAGDDTFQFNSNNNTGSAVAIDGGAGTNTLAGRNTANTWTIPLVGASTLGVMGDAVYVNSFTNIQTLKGGSGDDFFNIEIDFAGTINGGSGANTVLINKALGDIVGGDDDDIYAFGPNGSATSLDGGGGNNTLIGRNTNNTWTLPSVASGAPNSLGVTGGALYVNSFTNIQNLQGNAGVDTFVINKDFSGTIKGGLGADIFHINAAVGNIFGEGDDDSFIFSTEGSAVAIDGGSGVNTLTARDAVNNWSINAVNAGDIFDGANTKYTSFGNIQIVQGGSFSDSFTFDAAGKVTSVDGGLGANNLTGRNATSNWSITGVNTGTVSDSSNTNYAAFANIQMLQGGSSSDNFIFDLTGKVTAIDGGLGANTLAGRNAITTWNITAANTGNLVDANSINYVSFANVQSLIGGSAVDNFIFNLAASVTLLDGGAGSNTLTGRNADTVWSITAADTGNLQDSTNTKYATFKNIQTLNGGAGADIFNIDFAISTAINAGNGANVFNINTAVNTLIGGNDNDSFVLGTNGSATLLDGGLGVNTLKGHDAANTWTIAGANAGDVRDTNNIAYAAFKNVQMLQGGSAADTFKFSDAGKVTSIDGGLGANTIEGRNGDNNWNILTANAGDVRDTANIIYTSFANIQTLTGGSAADNFVFAINGKITSLDGGLGANSLTGRNANTTWNITATNGGDLVDLSNLQYAAFARIQTLQGGSSVDTFNINQAFSGNIKGGAGADVFNINATVTGTLFGEADDDSFVLGNTGSAVTVDGGGAAENNTLRGRNAITTWNITATNAGDVLDANNTKYLSFSNIQNLQGGSAVDTFNIAADFTGTIKAGADNDIFNINAAVGKLLGEAGDDKFIFSSNTNTGSADEIDGGAGTNTLVGRNATANTWTIPLAGASTLGVTGAALYVNSFSNIQALVGGSGDDTFNIEIDFSGSIDAGGGLNTFVINKAVGDLIGGDNDDIFTFGLNGTATSLDGGKGVNTLVGRDKNNTWNITGSDSGTLGETGGALYVNTFTNIQKIQGGTAADIFNINHSFSGDIKGGLGNDVFAINATVGNVYGGDGDDTFTFGSAGFATLIDGGLGTNNKIVGHNADNTWTLTTLASGNIQDTNSKTYYAVFAQIQSLQGGSSNDTLLGANTATTWTITAKDAGTLSDAQATTLQFSSIENLIGNKAADNFIFTTVNSSISGLIDGGTSTDLSGVIDTLDVKARTNGIVIDLGDSNTTSLHVKNIESISAAADASQNYLNGSSELASYTWIIDGANKGSVAATDSTSIETKTTFENFGHILGGNKIDQFQVGNNGSIADIDGGDGEDYLDYSNKTLVNINLGSNGSLGSTAIKGIEGIKGNNDGRDNVAFDSIIAADGGNTWAITGINSGEITINGKTISFENFNIINGGSGDDKFQLGAQGQLIGSINGGAGNNIFDASASSLQQIVAIDGTALKQTNVTNIKNIIGNAATDSLLIGADQNNNWKIGANASGTVNKSGTSNNEITFSGFSRLVGSSQKDVFTINNADGLNIILDGGSATGTDDEVNLSASAQDVIVGAGEQSKADIKVINISKLTANPDNDNTLVADDTTNNTWNIIDKNKGTLNTQLTFDGFANLLGGQNQDVFSFNGALAVITGVIDGGAGQDSLSLTGAERDLSVHIVNANKAVSASDINIINVEAIDASADHINNLLASDADNQWSIIAKNSGSLVNAGNTINFTNFTNLIGGTGNDNFVFDAMGSLTGYIDGGAGDTAKDVVDVSKVSHANIVLGNDGTGYRNVENYIGNNVDSILTGDKNDNTWTLAAEQNSGDINNKIFFSGFATLVGGSGNDSFNILQGGLSGSIFGGAGNDTFIVSAGSVIGGLNGDSGDDILKINIASDSAMQTKFAGGAGINNINVSGGDANYSAVHTSVANNSGSLGYTNQDNKGFAILYSDVAAIRDDLIANSLTLNNTSGPDAFVFSNNAYTLNNSTAISYSNKVNLIVAGAVDDLVSIEGEVNNVQSLTIQNASVSSTPPGLIRIKELNLNGVGVVGSAANRLNLSVDNLSVTSASGDIYVKEENSLTMNGFSNNQRFDLLLGGDLNSTTLLASFGDIAIDSAGAINLTQDNILSGNLTLSAAGDIKLHNVGAINLNNVKAQNLDINSTGAINGNGVMTVAGRATFTSGDNIILMNTDNAFNELTIGSAINASVTDKDSLILTGAISSGLFDVHSQGLNINGAMNVAELAVDAGQKAAALDANVLATSSISINATGITTSGTLTAADVNLNSLTGDILLGGAVDTSNQQTITLTGNNIAQNGKIISGGDTNIHATGSFVQSADIESAKNIIVTSDHDLTMNANTTSKGESVNYFAGGAMNLLGNIIATDGTIKMTADNTITLNGNSSASAGVNIVSTNGDVQQRAQITTQQGDIMMLAGGNISMSGDGVSTAANGNINYSAQNIALNLLDAKNGAVLLTATKGAITDNNGAATNIIAKGLDAVAATGIGADDALETSVSELALSNTLGNIAIVNNQAVTISQLRTNGDINFINLAGNVVLSNQPALGQGETPNRPATDTTYQTNNLIIKVNSGNLLASGSKNVDQPEITANNAALIVSGTIGLVNRPLVIDADAVAVTSRRTWKPIFTSAGTVYTDIAGSSASASDITATSHEQLVQVETLAEVNPAVFTNVRNYVYDDVAILLPEDQRYDDSEK